jgi:Flp pilus assembly protein TadG
MVEFAFVLPVFLLVLFGIIDFGLALNDYNSLRQGVREGAREGVVADWGSACTGTSAQQLICLTDQRIGLGATNTRVKVKLEDTYTVGDELTVCAMYPVTSTTGLFQSMLTGKVLESKITMRLENLDSVNPLTTTAETALPGKDWSWC